MSTAREAPGKWRRRLLRLSITSTLLGISFAVGVAITALFAPVASSEPRAQHPRESANETGIHAADRIVGNWKRGDYVKAVHLLINADGTFSTRDYDVFSGRGNVRTSEGAWTLSGDSVTLVEKSFEGNKNAGGDQQRDMTGTLTGSVLKLNALEFQRED